MEDVIYGFMSIALVVVTIYFWYKGVKFIISKIKGKNNLNNNLSVNDRKDMKTIKLPWVTYVEGIEYLREGQECNLVVDDEKLTIITDKTKTFNISLEQIVNAGMFTKKEIETKNKSVIGRSIVGSVFGLGLLGAMSGIGQKVKKKNKYFLIINYKSKNSDTIKILSFGLMVPNERFVKMLKKRINNDVNIDL